MANEFERATYQEAAQQAGPTDEILLVTWWSWTAWAEGGTKGLICEIAKPSRAAFVLTEDM